MLLLEDKSVDLGGYGAKALLSGFAINVADALAAKPPTSPFRTLLLSNVLWVAVSADGAVSPPTSLVEAPTSLESPHNIFVFDVAVYAFCCLPREGVCLNDLLKCRFLLLISLIFSSYDFLPYFESLLAMKCSKPPGLVCRSCVLSISILSGIGVARDLLSGTDFLVTLIELARAPTFL